MVAGHSNPTHGCISPRYDWIGSANPRFVGVIVVDTRGCINPSTHG